jgi:hypothetical protein
VTNKPQFHDTKNKTLNNTATIALNWPNCHAGTLIFTYLETEDEIEKIIKKIQIIQQIKILL